MAEWETSLRINHFLPESDLDNLKREVATPFPNYALTLPRYSRLDGTYKNVGTVSKGEIGYVSEYISGDNGVFEIPPVLIIKFTRKKVSKGLHFIFNPISGDYASELKINWSKAGTTVLEQTFYPTSADYMCEADVSLFDTITVTFYKTSKPYRRLWLAYAESYRLLAGAGLVIDYYDVAYKGKENSNVTTDDAQDCCNLDLLLNNSVEPYKNYSPALPDYAKLDGSWINAPDDMTEMPFTSKQISGADGVFADPPSVTLTCTETIKSVGIQLFFNLLSGDYCSDVTLAWYLDDTLIHSEEFYPDSPNYTCDYLCEAYNKLVITFNKTSKPYRYAFLTGFYYGFKLTFTSKQITKCTTYHEIASIGESLPKCTLNFSVRNDLQPFIFEKSQDLYVSFDGQPISHFYLTTGERTSEVMYTIKGTDIKQILEGKTHVGGFYSGAKLKDVLTNEIFDGLEVELVIDDSIADKTITGWLPYGNCRDNLAQICFACGAIVDTSFGDGVYVYAYDSSLSPRSITNNLIYANKLKIKTGDPITGVAVTAYSWGKATESQELYKGTVNGSATVVFDSPMHDLACDGGIITESGDNYAVISASGAVTVTGQGYDQGEAVYKKENPIIYRNKKLAETTDATLITDANVDEVVNRLYDYYALNNTISADMLLGNIELSDIVMVDTFAGQEKGIVTALNLKYYGEVKAGAKIKCLL